MNKYQIIGACGEGFYGTVFKSRHKPTNTVVAIKQFKGREDYATKREIETLSKLKHPNIINLREVFREQGKLHMVFEFLDTDLLNALGQYPKGMPEKLVKIYMSQLCKALEYCHQRCVVHRDLKPENLLVVGNIKNPDPKRSLKLCDFGEARDVGPADKFLSGIIGTRWYRAPEILVGAKVATKSNANDASSFNKVTRPKLLKYDFQVDMWGAGCIMGELLLANPMFPADTDIQQLEMVQVYGTPQQLTKRFSGKCSANCASALKGLLDLSPHTRLTARSALQHQYFAGRKSSKNTLVDSYSANTSRQRAKFQPQFKQRSLGDLDDIDEEIHTESDNDMEEELSDDDDMDMPEEDVDGGYNDNYGGDGFEDLDEKDSGEAGDDNHGYSDDDFEEGYSDDEFEEVEEEPVPAPAPVPQKPAKTKAKSKPPSSQKRHKPTPAASKTAAAPKPSSRQAKLREKNSAAARTGTGQSSRSTRSKHKAKTTKSSTKTGKNRTNTTKTTAATTTKKSSTPAKTSKPTKPSRSNNNSRSSKREVRTKSSTKHKSSSSSKAKGKGGKKAAVPTRTKKKNRAR